MQYSIRNSQMLRFLFVGFLALLLQIPIVMISNLVAERQYRHEAVISDISSKWGEAQEIVGPALVVPYTYKWTETLTDGKQVNRSETREAVFLPTYLQVRGDADSEVRSRGIYSVPVYNLDATLEGEFARPSFSELGLAPAAVDWERAYIAIGISDARAIQEESVITWNGKRISFLPGTSGFKEADSGIHAVVGIAPDTQTFKFSLPLVINGSQELYFAPFAQNTVVELASDYSHPSFQGNWLPTERNVSSNAFQAKWSIPFLGRNYPQAWKAEDTKTTQIANSQFGVEFVNPIDNYRMAERSVKYAFFFIILTFAAVWLIEVLARLRIHPIQYLLLGGALCLFYLLELSFSEHLGFPLAYAIASIAVIGMVASYSVVALRSLSRGVFVGIGVAALYVYLYILLMNEDFALLIGSLGLFAILAGIMYVTRRVDWYSIGTYAVSDADDADDADDVDDVDDVDE